MALKKEEYCCILWLLILTTAAQGYRSCSELQAENQSEPFTIEFDGEKYNVSCNMSVIPAKTIIKVLNSKDVVIMKPFSYPEPLSYSHDVRYGIQNKVTIKKLVELSESCEQFVSYKCKNALLFGRVSNPVSNWITTEGDGKTYWGDCKLGAEKRCNCDKVSVATDEGYLTKKKDLPVSILRFGGFNNRSNVSFTVGDLVCYGDEQKNAFTFENLNSFIAMNLSSNEKQIEFKFKTSTSNKNKTIATIEMTDDKHIKVRFNMEMKLEISQTLVVGDNPITFEAVKEKWYRIKLQIVDNDLHAWIDGQKSILVESRVNSVVAKLSFGDPSRKCNTFIGCIKDVKIDDTDRSSDLQDSKIKEFVKEGCHEISSDIECLPPKKNSGGGGGGGGGDGGDNESGDGSGSGGGSTDDDGEKDDDGNSTAVIVVVVIFLLLLILLLVAFFVTWYLKRNKGVYQTHEGSAENIHGDTDNLTLVTRHSEQEADSEKTKEYYL